MWGRKCLVNAVHVAANSQTRLSVTLTPHYTHTSINKPKQKVLETLILRRNLYKCSLALKTTKTKTKPKKQTTFTAPKQNNYNGQSAQD